MKLTKLLIILSLFVILIPKSHSFGTKLSSNIELYSTSAIAIDSNSDLNVFNCTLINGRIIIEYNKNLYNSKYSCVIGSLEPNNFLINNEYALIFNNYS